MAEPTAIEKLIAEHATRMDCQRTAIKRYQDGQSVANVRANKYRRYHSYYQPVDGDQWPDDAAQRPQKIHITANIIKAFVDVESRILSLLPRITNVPPAKDVDSRRKGEVVEDLFGRYLELSDWEVWMGDWNRLKSLYGIGILKPYWDEENKRPGVRIIEQPMNLMLGWGASDFSVLDWAIYKYYLSPSEAIRRFPDIIISARGAGKPLDISRRGTDHTDPLDTLPSGKTTLALSSSGSGANDRVQSGNTQTEYEDRQVELWDYWYYDAEGKVYNAVLLQQVVVMGPILHTEMPRIPYIITENDHEPGSAEGVSTVEALIDIQMGLNRAFSHFAQVVADNSGSAYQMTGENADAVPEGIVPKEDQIIPAGSGNRIEPIARNVNNFPMQELIKQYMSMGHFVTGLPEIMFGNIPSADTSGRVMAIQIEAGQNRIDSKRRREYSGLRDLLLFWGYMIQKKNPKVTVSKPSQPSDQQQPGSPTEASPGLETTEIQVGNFIKGFERWNIVAPEITPRDSIETAQNVINLVNAKLMPLIEGMDRVGIENPEQMLALVEAERSNARLFPADVQGFASVVQLFQSIMAQQQMQQQQMSPADAQQQSGPDQAAAQAAAQQAQPSGFEDQNQPQTQAGMAPPPGAGAPGGIGQLETLIRNTPSGQSQSMSQLKMDPRRF